MRGHGCLLIDGGFLFADLDLVCVALSEMNPVRYGLLRAAIVEPANEGVLFGKHK